MVTANMIVYTEAERTEAMSYNETEYLVDPRAIDADDPGVGVNINENAENVDMNEEMPLEGKYVTGTAILTNPAYPQDMKDYLATLPVALLNTEVIFIPE